MAFLRQVLMTFLTYNAKVSGVSHGALGRETMAKPCPNKCGVRNVRVSVANGLTALLAAVPFQPCSWVVFLELTLELFPRFRVSIVEIFEEVPQPDEWPAIGFAFMLFCYPETRFFAIVHVEA